MENDIFRNTLKHKYLWVEIFEKHWNIIDSSARIQVLPGGSWNADNSINSSNSALALVGSSVKACLSLPIQYNCLFHGTRHFKYGGFGCSHIV